ncbi:MAG: phosphotransferase system enzyme I (PtsI)/phosphotransferase system enzyme I (PtsP) [Halioglobus sp.]|jgi:phosphotransferase system enzyme I (PtsI)/phosphotransferase system enzyme I (PtsP)
MISHYAELFLAMEDPYLRARNEDIKHLGNRLYETWRGRGLADVELEITTPVVLVGEQVSISDIAGVPKEYLAGIVCFGGSVMSHTAVLANALGVPAVMGLGELKGICNGETIIVDGDHGAVVLHPDEAIQKEYELLLHARLQEEGELSHWRDRPALTLDGHRVQLYANSGLLADISPGINNGAEGLGLYRTEIPFMISETFPSEQAQVDTYQQVFNAYQDKPVYMRILDIGGDKPLPYFPIHEENPALGWRGIRICLDNTSLLMTQLRAMLRAAIGRDTLHILLPMVSAYDELLRFHSVLHDALDQLKKEGHCVTRPPVGIMVEVPAAISQLAKWRDQIDFVSIGSNDLSQYLLAADRNNPRVASTYDHLHPAVLVEIQRVVDSAKSLGLPLCLCGEMSSDPLAVLLLVGMGVRRLSMSAAHLPRVKKTICQVDTKSCERLLEESLCLRDADDIRNILSTHMEAAGSLS